MDFLEGLRERVFPVGRLDYAAEGLLLLTNDGDLAFGLTRPGGTAKTYRVKVKGTPDPDALERLRGGLRLDGRPLLPADAQVESRGDNAWVRVTLREGRQNQIVRMMEAIGHPVRRLRRMSVGPVRLGSLPAGHWRVLDPTEVRALQQAIEEAEARRRQPPRCRPARSRGPGAARGGPSRPKARVRPVPAASAPAGAPPGPGARPKGRRTTRLT